VAVAVMEAGAGAGAGNHDNILQRVKLWREMMDTQSTSPPENETSNEALQETIKAMAALIATMQKRERSLEALISQQLQVLNGAVSNVDRNVNRVVERALPRLTDLTHQALSVALEPAAARFDRTLTAANQTLQQATQRYAQAQQSLEATAMRRI